MRKAVAILAVIVLVTVAAYLFLAGQVGDAPALRVRFPFAGYTNSPTGPLAVFTIVNHPGYVSFRFAFIQQSTATGWVTVRTNVPVSMSPAGPTLAVPSTNVPLRCVFELSEEPRGLLYGLRRILPGSGRKGSVFGGLRRGWVTNDTVNLTAR